MALQINQRIEDVGVRGKDGGRKEITERGARRYCIATISRGCSLSPLSFTLSQLRLPSTRLRAMACLGFLSISCSTAPEGGS